MSREVDTAVQAGLARWRDRLPPVALPIHRRAVTAPPRAGLLRVGARGLVWLWAALRWVLGVGVDALSGKRGVAHRAARGAAVLQDLGGTFVKLGQQLSLRADVLAPEWCEALAALRDAAPPLAPAVARRVIEASTGRPLEQLYAEFDWAPLGSASVACVYRASLPSGRRVAVKVRRPEVALAMAADLALMAALARLAETLSMARGDQATSFVEHLRTVLLDELDFTRELRNIESFRRSCREAGLKWLRAPRPHPERCAREVLTLELVEALPAALVLAAAEGDPAARARVRAAGIDPRRAGVRLFRAWNEQVFHFERFHGDPHPANLFIGPGDVLWLVDFGACGAFTEASRRVLRRIQNAVLARDVGEMVQAALALVEPHPPVDMDRVGRRLERLYSDYLASIQSDSAPWWEKATSRFWLAFVDVAREHGIPVNLDTLRLFRASFLMDTLAYRLAPDLDIREEYAWFFARERRRREGRILREGLRGVDGAPLAVLGQAEDAVQVGIRAIQRAERFLDRRTDAFALATSKGAAAAASFFRMLNLLVWAAVVAAVVGILGGEALESAGLVADNPLLQLDGQLREALVGDQTWGLDDLFRSPLFWVGSTLILLGGLRGIRRRLEDIDP